MLLVLLYAYHTLNAQDFRSHFDAFTQQSVDEFNRFREACNQRYVEFLRQAWVECEAQKAIDRPKEEWLPPVIVKEDRAHPAVNRPISIETVVFPPKDTIRPHPFSPVVERPVDQDICCFDFFNTQVSVRVAERCRFRLESVDERGIAAAWESLSGPAFDNALVDCLQFRDKHRLCDWAYLLLLHGFSHSFFDTDNEATLLTAYLFSQSGYQMRLGRSEGKLFLLVATDYQIYNQPFYTLDGQRYWALGQTSSSLRAVSHDFPGGRPLSLAIEESPLLECSASEERIRTSFDDVVSVSCQVNLNLLALYDCYPDGQWGNNPLTRWALYANAPLDPYVRTSLYPALQEVLSGKSLSEAADILLNFVQTAFSYQSDDKEWGYDRSFFAEETLFYPYADCEDRSILYARLVRDLLGLDVVLVYYPGHLATAVKFPKEIPGDYLELDSGRYLVCDPTYIGASIGMTMPTVKGIPAQAILLK